jgi:hypothetical protein
VGVCSPYAVRRNFKYQIARILCVTHELPLGTGSTSHEHTTHSTISRNYLQLASLFCGLPPIALLRSYTNSTFCSVFGYTFIVGCYFAFSFITDHVFQPPPLEPGTPCSAHEGPSPPSQDTTSHTLCLNPILCVSEVLYPGHFCIRHTGPS